MRLVKFFTKKREVPPALREEFGFSGAQIWAGLAQDPYNPKLSGKGALKVFDEMRKTDGAIQALELAITLPLRTCEWFMEGGPDEVREFVSDNLFRRMTITFDDFLREAFLALFYGFVPFEKIFEEGEDGYIRWRKFASRHPLSIQGFLLDEEGGPAGIRQSGILPSGVDKLHGGMKTVDIPIEKLIIFIWRKEFGGLWGFSLLRPAYKHWLIADRMYRIANISFERWAAGTPVGKLPQGYSPEDFRKFEQILESLRTHETARVVLPPGYDLDILHGAVERGVLDYIEHHKFLMLQSVLTQFLMLGLTRVGARAVSEDHQRLFLLALNAVADWFCEHLNRYAIPQLVDFNFSLPEGEEYPKLNHSDVWLVFRFAELGQLISALAQAGLLTPGREMEAYIRTLLGLPQLEEGEEGGVTTGGEALEPRPLLLQEGPPLPQYLDHHARLQRLSSDFVQSSERIILRQHAEYWRKLEPKVRKLWQSKSPKEAREAFEAISKTEVPLKAEYKGMVKDFLLRTVEEGRKVVEAETGESPSFPHELRLWIDLQSETVSNHHAEQLKFVVIQGIMSAWRGGLPLEEAEKEVKGVMRERTSIDLREDLLNSARMVVERLGEAL